MDFYIIIVLKPKQITKRLTLYEVFFFSIHELTANDFAVNFATEKLHIVVKKNLLHQARLAHDRTGQYGQKKNFNISQYR